MTKKSVKTIYGLSEKIEMKCYVSWADGIIIVLWPKLYLMCLRDIFSLVFLSSFSEGSCFLCLPHMVEMLTIFFCKVWLLNYQAFGALGSLSSLLNSVLCKSSHKQYVNEKRFSNKTVLWTLKFDLPIISHVMEYNSVDFFQLFKNLKIILSSQI